MSDRTVLAAEIRGVAELAGRRVALVEDVVSSGGALIAAAEQLQADGIRPVGAVCVIDRESGGAQALAQIGVALRSLLTETELMQTPGLQGG